MTVGCGPGGAEVVLAMAHRLRACHGRVKWSLVAPSELLPGYPRRAARLMARRLAAAGIVVRTGAEAVLVEGSRLHFRDDGSGAAFDALPWATGAVPQDWIAASGLTRMDGGFMQINGSLQSTSHPHVFAALQGPVLADNLLRFAFGQPLSVYRPQHDYLSLLSTGGRHAIASWHSLV